MDQLENMEMEDESMESEGSETAFIPSSVCGGSYKPGDTVTLKVISVDEDGTLEVGKSEGEPSKPYEEAIDDIPEE